MTDLKRYGGHALITGASSGIGAELARQIAAAGVPCVLVARREERLKELAAELERAHGLESRVVAADLSTREGVQQVVEATGGLELGMLVNNAGFGDPGRLAERSPERLVEMIGLNCQAPALLTRALLPAMLERGRGALVFVSSALGLVGCAHESTYSATKAFDLVFGEALWGELEGSGVDVVTVCPASTRTEFLEAEGYPPEQIAELYRGADTPQLIARITLAALGRKPVVMARDSRLLDSARRLLPRSCVIRLLRKNMKRAQG